jgi:hypothetical protein
MQTKAHDQKWYFEEDHDAKEHDQGKIGCSFANYYFGTHNEMSHFR